MARRPRKYTGYMGYVNTGYIVLYTTEGSNGETYSKIRDIWDIFYAVGTCIVRTFLSLSLYSMVIKLTIRSSPGEEEGIFSPTTYESHRPTMGREKATWP